METVDGAKDTELYPSCVKLIVFDTHHMTADIMAPPGVSDIGCCNSKIGLIIQRGPCDKGIAGEAERITLTSDTGES